MKCVYLVRTSDVEDGTVYAAYGDLPLAEKAAAFIDDGIVEAYELNQHAAEIQAGLSPWWMTMAQDGTIVYLDKATGYSGVLNEKGFSVQESAKWGNGNLNLRCNLFAQDKEHAVKVADEIRLRLLAQGQFVAGMRGT